MKKFVTLAAAAALMAGVSIAGAQTSPPGAAPASPADLNAGSQTGSGKDISGSQMSNPKVGGSDVTLKGGAAEQVPPGDANAGTETGTTGAKSGSQMADPKVKGAKPDLKDSAQTAPSSINAGSETGTTGSKSGSQPEKK